jgi:hypothetical protein
MLPSLIRRVVIAQHRTDFRKRFDGLLGEAYRLGADPYDCILSRATRQLMSFNLPSVRRQLNFSQTLIEIL